MNDDMMPQPPKKRCIILLFVEAFTISTLIILTENEKPKYFESLRIVSIGKSLRNEKCIKIFVVFFAIWYVT